MKNPENQGNFLPCHTVEKAENQEFFHFHVEGKILQFKVFFLPEGGRKKPLYYVKGKRASASPFSPITCSPHRTFSTLPLLWEN